MGRGWFSRLRDAKGTGSGGERAMANLPLGAIETGGAHQPRKLSGDADIEALKASILERGVIEPIVVRKKGSGWEVIAGERRVRAARMAGLAVIPAVVVEADDKEAALISLVENVQRVELNPLEEAEGYRRVLASFGLTQEGLGKLLGKSQPAIANKLRLLGLGQEAKKALRNGSITERHARELLRLDGAEQEAAVEAVVEGGLSVKETERLVRRLNYGGERPGQRTPPRRKGVCKDIRLFLNSIRQVVRTLRETGVGAKLEERDEDGWMLLTIRIPKDYGGSCRSKGNDGISRKAGASEGEAG